jgi:hypothetical protein
LNATSQDVPVVFMYGSYLPGVTSQKSRRALYKLSFVDRHPISQTLALTRSIKVLARESPVPTFYHYQPLPHATLLFILVHGF